MPDLMQLQCSECEELTRPFDPADPPPADADMPADQAREDGSWVTTGLLCSSCSAKVSDG